MTTTQIIDEFKCTACNYLTTDRSNYSKHIGTKTHKWNQNYMDQLGYPLNLSPPKDSDIILTENAYYCNHCNKLFCKKNRATHLNLCTELNNALNNALNNNKSVDYYKQQIKDLNNQLVLKDKDAEINLLKLQLAINGQHINNNTINNIVNNNNNNNSKKKIINLVYITKNYVNAPIYEDIMKPKLSQKEKKSIQDLPPSAACTKIVRQRCLDNIDMEERPLHCLDISRNNFAVRIKDKNGDPKWKTDSSGELILKTAFSTISKEYPIKNTDIKIIVENQQNLLQMHSSKHKKKILQEISTNSYVR
jgi:hypothetical protein